MKIRSRNNILKAVTGVLFSTPNINGANWRLQVFNNYKNHILSQLKKYGEADDYGFWLNDMQHRHSQIYNKAQQSGNWQQIAYEDPEVGKYQQDYKGGLGNDGTYQRFGSIALNNSDNYDFNLSGIRPNLDSRYNINNPPSRTSGDFNRNGYNYKVDNLYSAITDDRRLLGRKGDWNENSLEYKDWNNQLNNVGWEMYFDESDGYYKLKRFNKENTNPYRNLKNMPEMQDAVKAILNLPTQQSGKTEVDVRSTDVDTSHKDKYGFDWSKLREGFLKIVGNPNLYALGRLAGNLYNNERVYDEQLKGISPVLKLTYNTHRQVVGDEATKQTYYRRAVQGQTRASRPFTSDADRLVAYMMEAKRIGDELRAQGDLADNQEIRRTSDESNQHLWANIQRSTEVANANLASINQANALKHNLLAQKYSAQWSSIDNFLQGIEYRKRQRQEEQNALDDQIFALVELSNLSNDPEYLDAYNRYSKIIEANTDKNTGNITWNNITLAAKREFEKARTNAMVRSYLRRKLYYQNRGTIFAKSGTKVTQKKKDDLLYKSTKDVVEHFRKMSKLSSDALNRKQPKIEKLTSHPKGKTKKYLYGGVAPFTVYKPVALGGETTTSSSAGTSSTKSKSEGNETLDMIKELFKQVAGKGLPSDVNSLYVSMLNFLNRAQAFGENISTEDIASMYLSNMQKLNLIQYLKANYDNAEKAAIANDAINEFAVDFAGRLVGLDKEGNIKYVDSLEDAKEKEINPLTNGLLLQLRAIAPSLAGRSELDTIVANGVGMSKIAEFLKSQLPSLGSSEQTIEGYTKKDSSDIKAGLELLQQAPIGDYKFTKYNKDLQKQALMAMAYLKGILPSNMKRVIETRAELNGLSVNELIGSLVSSNMSESSKIEFDAVTGKAAKDANSNSKEGNVGDMIPAVAFFQGLGEQNTFVILDKTTDGLKINTISAPITSKGNNTGLITFDLLSSSDFGGLLRMDSATMGDSLIAPNGGNNIIIGERIYLTELPIDKNAASQGVIKPDLSFLKNIEKADAQLKSQGIDKSDPKNIPTINKVYLENGLPVVYTISGNKPVLTSEYARFAMVNATATEDAFGEEPEFNDGVSEVSDKERDLFQTMMQKLTNNSKYKLNNGWGPFGGTKVYNGIIYIPMVTSTISALGGTGYKGTSSEYNLIESLQQQANAAREIGFKPAGDASNL